MSERDDEGRAKPGLAVGAGRAQLRVPLQTVAAAERNLQILRDQIDGALVMLRASKDPRGDAVLLESVHNVLKRANRYINT